MDRAEPPMGLGTVAQSGRDLSLPVSALQAPLLAEAAGDTVRQRVVFQKWIWRLLCLWSTRYYFHLSPLL